MSSSLRSACGRTAGTAVLLLAPILAGAAAPPPPPFLEADDVGLDFVHVNGRHGELYFVENVGAGAALFDYDGDGDLDLYLVQGEALGPEAQRQGVGDRLFRNDLTRDADGRPVLRFTDVTAEAGLAEGEYGMGVAAGDFDGDGHVDLYVTNWGPNRLWRNRGDGTFEDVTAASGTGEPRWSVSATFVDYDRDGDLDLFVGNYVAFSYAVHKVCRSESGLRDYCTPLAFAAESDRLFENRGDGTFADATRAAGLDRVEPAGALGVVAADLDGDGWVDLYVANDLAPNHLWINRGDGTFREEALLAGCAVDGQGRAQASMGVDAADFDGDGDEDLFLTHLTGEANTLYVNDGSGMFRDGSIAAGLAAPSLPFTGFGTAFLDYDGDGRLDLLAANGAVRQIEALARAGDPYPLHQTNQLFRNLGAGADGRVRFADVSAAAGE
ncbi:MAG TPA: VCBS repeat-containing protein, partial [Thermoanaerobaculia bacterium]|nr:VCBS repeat-containing protein [Thermoanaerobaculia bacterium]